MSLKCATNPLLAWQPIPVARDKMDFPCGTATTSWVWLELSVILLSQRLWFWALPALLLVQHWTRGGSIGDEFKIRCVWKRSALMKFLFPQCDDAISLFKIVKLWCTIRYHYDSTQFYLLSMWCLWTWPLLPSAVSYRIHKCEL